MTKAFGGKRTDTASKWIKASAQTIYKAFVNPTALMSWLPPEGMEGHIEEFDVREGGVYRMTLTYVGADHSTPGKTSDHADVVSGRFLKLVPGERIVQQVEFASEDPAFAGTMTMSWLLTEVHGGTEVTILCENVPGGIRQEDHDAGLKSSLENLAAFTEQL
ncbi:SRPBCC family protein [Cohnella cellulosilytica]|uniref:SRPBCC family protein n=1 Tax=Cohnella cellulosilytica TaxID=986710 RepID=A0ABW2FEV4_9BACL